MKKKFQLVISLLTGLMFINAGLNKIFNYIPIPDDLPEQLVSMNSAMADIGWLLPLTAVAEIIGGALFMTPRFRALGAITLFPVMIGILLIHLTVAPSGLPIAVIIFLILVWGMYEDRKKILPLIQKST